MQFAAAASRAGRMSRLVHGFRQIHAFLLHRDQGKAKALVVVAVVAVPLVAVSGAKPPGLVVRRAATHDAGGLFLTLTDIPAPHYTANRRPLSSAGAVEKGVGEVLCGQRANRQPDARAAGRPAGDDARQQAQESVALETPAEQIEQRLVPDRGKIAVDIDLNEARIRPQAALDRQHGGMHALAPAGRRSSRRPACARNAARRG
ncbi:MAG: hypothetical protein IPK02_13870 [Candidatus Accumulibacter sp.]|uniref:Uncharacterized protein n=1 Tax=Candidatus Accumulibacter affinis TaxID=2954384 RepID=A0A935TCM0_9PROT|nr:hypothetical protein [Candidatus Accumulibacter affinis]